MAKGRKSGGGKKAGPPRARPKPKPRPKKK